MVLLDYLTVIDINCSEDCFLELIASLTHGQATFKPNLEMLF